MSSQIAAAEQLSDRLSKQMALLSIESPVKQQNVKKELFETLGIPYDASFSSPDVTKVMDQSSIKKLIHSSGSAATNNQSRRRQSSAVKSYDPETARRRRDSLDRVSLCIFYPFVYCILHVYYHTCFEFMFTSTVTSLPKVL